MKYTLLVILLVICLFNAKQTQNGAFANALQTRMNAKGSDEDCSDILFIFRELDQNADGLVDAHEAYTALNEWGEEVSQYEVDQFIATHDYDGDQALNISEFTDLVLSIVEYHHMIAGAVFSYLGTQEVDFQGLVSYVEEQYGEELSHEEIEGIQHFFQEADGNEDGVLTQGEIFDYFFSDSYYSSYSDYSYGEYDEDRDCVFEDEALLGAAEYFYDNLDTNKDGVFSFEEVCEWFALDPEDENSQWVWYVLEDYDENGDGTVDTTEVARALIASLYTCVIYDDVVPHLYETAYGAHDFDGDEQISFEEFAAISGFYDLDDVAPWVYDALRATFDANDVDGSGFLDAQELVSGNLVVVIEEPEIVYNEDVVLGGDSSSLPPQYQGSGDSVEYSYEMSVQEGDDIVIPDNIDANEPVQYGGDASSLPPMQEPEYLGSEDYSEEDTEVDGADEDSEVDGADEDSEVDGADEDTEVDGADEDTEVDGADEDTEVDGADDQQ